MANQIKERHYMPSLPKLLCQDGDEGGEVVPGLSEPCKVTVTRPIYDQESFGAHYRLISKEKSTLTEKMRDKTKGLVRCDQRKFMTSLRKWLPFIGIMRHYKRKWLVGDVISGISCGTVHIPQSLGYATLIGLPAVYGLYSSFFPLLVYFFFGTSHHLSMGTVAVVSLIVNSAVTKQLPNLRVVMDTLSINGSVTTPSPGDGALSSPAACGVAASSAAYFGDNTDFTTSVYSSVSSASVSKTSAAAVMPIDPRLQQEAVIMMVMTMTFVVGVMQFIMGICHLGIIASFMSTPFNTAYQTAAAFHTAVSQIAACLGYSIGAYPGVFTLIYQLKDILTHLYKTNLGDVIVAIITLVVLVFLKEFINVKFAHKLPVPIPADLLVVVLGTLISYLTSLNQRYCVKVVGNIPRGFPSPEVPVLLAQVDKDYYYLPTFIVHLDSSFILDCVAVAIVSYVMCMTMAKIFARKYRYALDDDQELIAYGLMNCVSSFFHCFPTAQSPPRTMIFETTGGMTQVSGVISAVVVMIIIVGLGPLFFNLPKPLLAMIIIVALFPLFKQFKELKVYWKINKFDFVVWVATFLAVLVLDLPTGLAVGIGWNLLTMCAQSFVVRGYNLSSANHSDLFVASNAYTKVSEIAGIKIFRYEADIFFANVANFKKQLFAQTVNPQRLQLLKEKLAAAKAGGQGQGESQGQLSNSNNQSTTDIVLTSRLKTSSFRELPAVTTRGLVNSGFSNITEEDECTASADSNNDIIATTSSGNNNRRAAPVTDNQSRQPDVTMLNGRKTSLASLSNAMPSLSDGKRVSIDLKHVTIIKLNDHSEVEHEREDTLTSLPPPSATSSSSASAATNTVSGSDWTRSKRKGSAAAAFDAFYRPPDLDNISIDEDDGDLDEDVADIRSHIGSSSLPTGQTRRVSVQMLEVHTVVLDCGAVGYIDFNGLLTIRQLFEDYRDANITFLLAGCGKFMLEKLKTSGIYDEWKQHIFPSIIDAVLVSQIRHKQHDKLASADV